MIFNSNLLYIQEEREKLTIRIQNAGTEVVEAKAGAVSMTIDLKISDLVFTMAGVNCWPLTLLDLGSNLCMVLNMGGMLRPFLVRKCRSCSKTYSALRPNR